MDIVCFWNNNHPLSPLADQLYAKFVPFMGSTRYIETEVMLAVLKVHHDCYNNGFGNNMSQPIAYVDEYHLPVASPEFTIAWQGIKDAAMEPWTACDGWFYSDAFNVVCSEVHLIVRDKDAAGTLRLTNRGIWDMPRTEIDYPAEEYEDDLELDWR